MKVIVKQKTVYGNDLIYPVCDQAQKLAKLTRKKTFDSFDIALIKSLGYSVELERVTL